MQQYQYFEKNGDFWMIWNGSVADEYTGHDCILEMSGKIGEIGTVKVDEEFLGVPVTPMNPRALARFSKDLPELARTNVLLLRNKKVRMLLNQKLSEGYVEIDRKEKVKKAEELVSAGTWGLKILKRR